MKSVVERYNKNEQKKLPEKTQKANFKWGKNNHQLERLECRPMEIT